ncbi:hypothetical protein RB213_006434, partial [Colletotrichum asianum]
TYSLLSSCPGPCLLTPIGTLSLTPTCRPVAFPVMLRYAPKDQLSGGYLDNEDGFSLSTSLPGDYAATCRCVRTKMLEW